MAAESDVLSEIEVLESIYLDELKATQKDDEGWEVSLVLYPSTAEDSLSQFVRLTLTLTLDSQYPSSAPSISIHNPRGLSDDKLLSVQKCLQMEAESCLGTPVLYQLIERAKEMLTESNIPHGNCVICLYGFKEGEAFTKTSCYHYFHSHCLGRYITHSETELREREREMEKDKSRGRKDGEELTVVCPVCREPLAYDAEVLLSSPAPCLPKLEGGVIGVEFRQKWVELQKILVRQKERGGVIDPEAESNRFLIHIYEAPSDAGLDTQSSQSLPPPPPISANQNTASQGQHISGHTQRRGRHGHWRRGDFKVGRRGRGGQVPGGIPPPPVEDLAKLTLSSKKLNHPKTASVGSKTVQLDPTLLGDSSEQILAKAQISQSEKTDGVGLVDVSQWEASELEDGRPISQSTVDNSESDGKTDSVEGGRGRGNRDRGRRGPRGSGQQPGQWQERNFRGVDHWDAPGGVYHHRGGRGSRGRGGGGVYNLHSRGGGMHRGSGRGFHQRVENEVGKEGVL